jgi:hypothetical protein
MIFLNREPLAEIDFGPGDWAKQELLLRRQRSGGGRPSLQAEIANQIFGGSASASKLQPLR